MEPSQEPKARSRRTLLRRSCALAAGGVWLRWSPVSFSTPETGSGRSRRPPGRARSGRWEPWRGASVLCDRGCGIEGDPGSAWRGRWGLVCLGVFGLFESEDAKHSRRRRQGRRREEKDALKQLLLEGPKGLQEGNRSLSDWFENLPFRKPKEAELKHRDEDEAAGILNILNSVKTSVQAAVLGTRVEEKEEKALESKESFAPFLPDFPAPPGLFPSEEDEKPHSEDSEPKDSEEDSEDWWQNAQAALGMTQSEPDEQEEEVEPEPVPLEPEVAEVSGPFGSPERSEPEHQDDDVEPLEEEEVLAPEVPGMEDANLIVRVEIEPKRQRVERGDKAVENLMSRSDREVLEAMAQEGWEVEVVDESKGLYMLSLPPVLYEVMGTSISIPAPRFSTQLRNTSGQSSKFKDDSTKIEERMEGDLILQNGENIFTLQLGFPFRTKLSISAAGWTRAKVGWEKDEILSSNYVEVGIQLPKVPGLTNIMEYFVKSYGTQSTQECTDALARAAERLPETPLQSIEDTMKEFLKPLAAEKLVPPSG